MPLPVVLKQMLSLPTAAFLESEVLDYIESRCQRLAGVTTSVDRYGNLMARYHHEPRSVTPLAFTAHTDHPGFVSIRMADSKTLLAEFRGWVDPGYFVGTKVRFWEGKKWIKGVVRKITQAGEQSRLIGRTAPPKELAISVSAAVGPNRPGMWDLPEPALKGSYVHARGCDDVAGCAAMLALLERLSKKRAKADCYCLFTRAEEVGFIGAIGAARLGTIPRRIPVIAIETSKALPGAKQGDGPILRVGDKTSVFSPGLTSFCDRVAHELQSRRETFKFQRRLMDGGTCESTAYYAYGYEATGMCVALGNYHNMDGKGKIASETIHLQDWHAMVDWFEALVMDEKGFGDEHAELREKLDKRFDGYEKLLAG